jgi:hypothetical protein
MTTRAVPSSRRRATSSSSSDSERWPNESTKAGIDLLQGRVVPVIPDLPIVKDYARHREAAYLRKASYFWKEKAVPYGVKPAERRGCSTDDGGYNEAALSQ